MYSVSQIDDLLHSVCNNQRKPHKMFSVPSFEKG